MFEKIKSLVNQTAIYGLSSIVGRLLYFILTPIHTNALSKSEYGLNADFYVLIGLLIVVTTYGMETTFFRYYEKYQDQREKVYSTILWSIMATTLLLVLGIFAFQGNIIPALKYEAHPEFLSYLVTILTLETITAVPMARLRAENKAIRFVIIRFILIGVGLILNLVVFKYLPYALETKSFGWQWFSTWYDPTFKVQYIFIINIISSLSVALALLPEFFKIRFQFDPKMWRIFMLFGIPLMIGGLGGVANELLDRQLLKYLLPADSWEEQVGIYAAVYKLSIFLVLFNQSFRYAAEPFFFATQKENNAKETYAVILRYFVMVMVIGLVFVWSYIDALKYFIDDKFWDGLFVLPILLVANIMLGINLNLSIWYKLIDKTYFGIVVTGIGLIFTIGLNAYFIPKLGYEGSAWATLISYVAMTITSYSLGQKYYKISYPVFRIVLYIFLGILAVLILNYVDNTYFIQQSLVFVAFVGTLAFLEKEQLLRLKQRVLNK